MLIGITGSIACGKSTVRRLLSEMKFSVLDCDDIAHDVIKKGRAAYYQIIYHFSKRILTKKKEIDRTKLGQIVFDDPEKKKFLESIIHPRVIRELQFKPKEQLIFVEVPLLYEAQMEKLFTFVIVVASSQEVQLQRLMKRLNSTEEEAMIRINAQMSQAEKIARADYVIYNNGDIHSTKEQLQKIVNEINEKNNKIAKA